MQSSFVTENFPEVHEVRNGEKVLMCVYMSTIVNVWLAFLIYNLAKALDETAYSLRC